MALLAVAAVVAACGSTTGPRGPAGPAGPTGPTVVATATPLPDFLAFSEYVGALSSSASSITVVNVTNPAAPVTVDTLTMPVCKDAGGAVLTPVNDDSSHGAVDSQDDVVAVQMCFGPETTISPNGVNEGYIFVFPYVRGGFGFPLQLFTNADAFPPQGPFQGIAVNGTTLDYGSLDVNGNASINVATYLPTTSFTPLTTVAVSKLTAFGVIAIGPKATFFTDFDTPNLYELSPNGLGGVATELPGPPAYGMTFDPSGRLWVAQGTSIGVRDGVSGAPISTISTGSLTNVFGIQFDRAGNLWITNPSSDGTTTTVNGYIAPLVTASVLPAPSSSFMLPNSVNFVQGLHRRPPGSARQR